MKAPPDNRLGLTIHIRALEKQMKYGESLPTPRAEAARLQPRWRVRTTFGGRVRLNNRKVPEIL